MAQLKDTIVSGNLRVTDTTLTDTLQVTIINAPTSSGGTAYGPGTNGQILKSNGTTTYWAADSNTDTKVTSTLLAQSTAAATYLPTFVSAAGNSGVNIMNSFSFGHTVGTTSAIGNSRIILGNATASGTANNEEGQIVLYSSGTSYHTIKGSATSSAVTHSLPTTGGTILNTGTTSFTQTLTSGTKVGSIKINGSSQDIYAPTNTNTTYTLTQDATDGHKITLTPSSGTAQTVTIPDNNTTYILSGAYGSSSNTWVTTLTPSSGTATTSTVPTASTSVYGITKLSSSTNSTSTALAATPSAVKSAYDLANGKSTVSFSASLTTGTKIGTITINGTGTDIYCETNTNTDTKVTDTVGTANTYYPAGGTSTSTATGTQVFDTSLKFIGTTGTTSDVGKAQLVLGNSTASGTANNKQGSLVVYGSTAYAHTIQGAPTAARTLTLPNKTGTFAVTSDIPTVNDATLTLKGAGTTVTSFTANSSSDASLDIVAGSNVTVTADATNAKISIASSHPTITKSTDTTSTVSPAHGGTFTTVDSVTRDGNGHVTKINTKTVTLPADTDENLLQSNTATSSYRPIVVGTTATTDRTALNTTVTGRGYVSNLMFSKPDIGYMYASAFSTSSYIDGTGVQLARYGIYLKSYAEQNTGTKYSYSRYALRTYSGKLSSDNGMLVELCGGGLTIVGSGESATSLSDLIADDQTVENPERLDVGGTLGTSFQGSSEQLILSSDNEIYFLTNCNTVADRKPVVLDTDSAFYPGTTKTGSIGTSSYYWNTAYIDSLNLSNTSVLSKASGDTYYYVERTDTGVRLGFGVGASGINHGVYSYELGGWLIYGNASDVLVRANLYNPSTEASLYALPLFGGTPSTGAHALYNNNGFRYSTLEGTTSAVGVARLVLGNGTASGTEGNKRGTIRLYSQSSSYIDLIPASTSSARTITIPAVTASMAVNRKALITDSNSDFASYAWHKFAEVTITSTNYDYVATFLVSSGFNSSATSVPGKIGVLTMHVRTNSSRIFGAGEFEWLFAGDQIDPRNFVMVYTDTANTSCKVELWYKQLYRYEGYTFNVVEEHTRTVKEIYTMTIYDQSGHGSASYTAGSGFITSKMSKLQTGGHILNNDFNIYTHEIKTDSYKVRNVAVSLNDVEGIMGTDVLCYIGYETNTADDTTLGAYADISTLSNTVTFDGYLARFSYFTVLICIGDSITNRYTIQLTSIGGYQSTQLIWGASPTQTGGSIYMTSALANITESNGNVTIFIGKCNSYLDFTSTTPTFKTTPDIHILKVYGHCIRSNGYH